MTLTDAPTAIAGLPVLRRYHLKTNATTLTRYCVGFSTWIVEERLGWGTSWFAVRRGSRSPDYATPEAAAAWLGLKR